VAQGQTTDRERQNRERNREKREAFQAKTDLAEVMALPAGRRFMYRLIYDTCELQSVYLAQDSGIYKHEGKRGVGAALAMELQTSHPEAFIQMITDRMQALKYTAVREPEPTGDDS